MCVSGRAREKLYVLAGRPRGGCVCQWADIHSCISEKVVNRF